MSDLRNEIFDAIKFIYNQYTCQNVPVYGVPENLKPYHTSKKDIEEGLEVIPQEMYRLRREDIYKITQRRAVA